MRCSALFIAALAIDRNEVDEWAGPYLGVTAVFTGIGALVGWAIDAANSKPHIRFDASPAEKTKVSVQPFATARGVAIAVSF